MRIKLLAFLSVFLLLNTACPPTCGPFHDKFDVVEIETELRSFSFGVISESAALSGVKANDLILFMNVIYNTFEASIFPTNPFMSTAYACSPAPPSPIQIVKSIQIHSDADLITSNKTYPAGTALDEIFDIESYDFSGTLTTFNAEGDTPASLYGSQLSLNTAIMGDQTHLFTLTYTQVEEAGGVDEIFTRTFYKVRLLE